MVAKKNRRPGTKDDAVIVPKDMYLEMLKLLPRARQVQVVQAVEVLAKEEAEEEAPSFTPPPVKETKAQEKPAKRFGHQTFYKPGKDRRKDGSLGRFG